MEARQRREKREWLIFVESSKRIHCSTCKSFATAIRNMRCLTVTGTSKYVEPLDSDSESDTEQDRETIDEEMSGDEEKGIDDEEETPDEFFRV